MLTDLCVLPVDTGRVWWRLLPQVLSVYLLGWLGAEPTPRSRQSSSPRLAARR